jgi:hypothetical protein
MASASGLTYRVPVESLPPRHGGGRHVRPPGRVGCVNHAQSPEELVARGQDTIDTSIAAANDVADVGDALPPPSRRLVLDVAR